jgi:hypothetical protein
MSTLFNRWMVATIWTGAVLGLFALFGPPLTPATGSILLLVAVAPAMIWLILSSAPPLTLSEAIAEELRPVYRSRGPVKGLSDGSPPHRR